jgi:hypothetical protein
MSLINDALKQARQTPPPAVSHPRPIFRSERAYGTPTGFWVVSGLLVLLIVGVTFLLGWSVSDHAVRDIATAPVDEAFKPAVVEIPRPVAPAPVTNPPEEAAVTPLPVLQGIFYSPTSPTAIVNGKTVGVGNMIGEYRVKAISKSAVTLEGPDGKEKQITL